MGQGRVFWLKDRSDVTRMDLFIYGAGGLAYDVIELIDRINYTNKMWSDIYFIDDFDFDRFFIKHKVVSYEFALNHKKSSEIVIAIGEPVFREQLFNKVKEDGFRIISLIDPTAMISDNVTLGEGCIVLPYVSISGTACVGKNVLIMPHAVFGHDTKICDGAIIGAQTFIGGHTTIGEKTYVASGSVIGDRIAIGSNVITSLGSVVFKDVPDNVIVMGNPARIIRKNEEAKVFK